METQELMSNFHLYIQEHGINILISIGSLILGWVILSLLAYILRNHIFRKMKINDFFESIAFKLDIEKILVRVFFFVGLVVLFKISSQLANLTEIDNFFDNVLSVVGSLMFLVFKAILPLMVALCAGLLTRKGILYFGSKFRLDERIGSKLDAGEALTFSFTKSLSDMGYGIVFLVFLPAILSGLGLEDMSQPFQAMIESSLNFMPKLFGAGIILAVGWFVAKIIKEVVTGLLFSMGADSALMKIQTHSSIGGGIKFSKLGGTLAYAVVLLLVFVEALKKLSLTVITDPIILVLNEFFKEIPNLIFAVFLMFLSYFVASIVRQILAQVLEGLGFDNILDKLGVSSSYSNSYSKTSPSQLVGVISFYGIMFFAAIESLNQIGLLVVADVLKEVTVFASQVIFGLVIFGFGLYISNVVTQTIKSSSAPNAPLLAFMARSGILFLVGAIALKRMGLADEIVNIAFGLIVGSLALGAGIAFGLGGKEHAAEILRDIRSKFKS